MYMFMLVTPRHFQTLKLINISSGKYGVAIPSFNLLSFAPWEDVVQFIGRKHHPALHFGTHPALEKQEIWKVEEKSKIIEGVLEL